MFTAAMKQNYDENGFLVVESVFDDSGWRPETRSDS